VTVVVFALTVLIVIVGGSFLLGYLVGKLVL
jgi:hypothetical protein